jgi:hypothetical protein
MLKATSAFSGSERPIFHLAMMSVSQLAHAACVNVSEARPRFPAGLYGDFRQPNGIYSVLRNDSLLATATATNVSHAAARTALADSADIRTIRPSFCRQ